MRPHRSALLVAVAAGVLGACSLLLTFNPDGQPCDAQGHCLTGYVCVDNVCHGIDGGLGACDPGGCDAGERCQPGTNSCVPDTCANRLCPVGTRCSETSGSTACVPQSAPLLGSPCSADSQCDAGVGTRFCFVGAISGPGGAHTGFCAEHCAGSFCATPSTTCATYSLGLDAGSVGLCLPDKLVTACSNDAPCQSEGFVCTVYDNPTLGPIGLCDEPNSFGAPNGQTCSNNGGTPCADGLCVVRTTSSTATTCGELCTSTSCDNGLRCLLVGYSAPDGASRKIPVCVP